MSIFAGKGGLAIAVAVFCLGAQAAHAQVAPVQYWIPGGPFGFGNGSTDGQGPDAGGGFSYPRTNLPNGLFVGGESGGLGLNGLSRAGAFGNFDALSYEGMQFGYNFKGAGGLPVTLFAGFDTLKYNAGAFGPLAPFSTNSATLPGYRALAGVEIQPIPNLSLSFGVGYTQQQSGRIDSDINSPLLPGESPILGGR
jgi:hypothetical protein